MFPSAKFCKLYQKLLIESKAEEIEAKGKTTDDLKQELMSDPGIDFGFILISVNYF